MDFESMMTTPVIYQDIPSSFMMSPMPVMPMMPMYGYGMSPMRPVLADDKFEKLQTKWYSYYGYAPYTTENQVFKCHRNTKEDNPNYIGK